MTVYRFLPSSRFLELKKVLDIVKDIIDYVKECGDKALIELTKKLDNVDIRRIAVDRDSLKNCCRDLKLEVRRAIDKIYEFLTEIHTALLPKDSIFNINGVKLGYIWRSIDRVGVYVPGGKKGYPSTLLMAGAPAKVAKVKRMYVASPPTTSECVNPAIAYIAQLLEVDEVYNVGGAQAIAALAYGTESVKKVDKIVGPGNIYVQAAKFLVQDVVAIDGIEGPTELVVVADESADPQLIALDMRAQAEHGYGTFIVLITDSKRIAQEVAEILSADRDHDYYVVTVEGIDKAIELANNLAPEHLSLYVSSAKDIVESIVNAGAISMGGEPPALVDYLGPNHILPTNRWARSRGALSVYDFLKPISVILDSKNIDQEILGSVKTLAKYEGFETHIKSIGVRFGNSID